MSRQLTRSGALRVLVAALCALLVLSVAGPAVAATPTETGADRGQNLADSDSGSATALSAAQSDGADANFTVERTAYDEFTVWLNASYADESVPNETAVLNISDSGGNLITNETWNLEGATAWNGTYNQTFTPPGPDSEVAGSLAEATVELNGTDVSDTASLQSVFFGDTPAWTNGSQIYVALSGTTGVGADDAVTARLGGDRVSPELRRGGNLLVFETSDVDGVTGERNLTVTDGGAPIAEPEPVEPDIRLATDEVQLWHPAVEQGTDYTVTVYSIDGESVNNVSTTSEATATGTVALPNASAVAGAQSVTVSLNGTGTLLDRHEVTGVDQVAQVDATVEDTETIRFGHSLAPLGIDAATVRGDNGSAYLPTRDITVDGRNLTLSGTTLNASDVILLETDAGVINVSAESDSNAAGDAGGNSSEQSGLLDGLFSALLPAGLLVPFLAGAVVAGLYAGRERGEPDYVAVGLGVVTVTCLIVLTYLIAGIVSIGFLTQPLVIGGALGILVVGAISYAVGGRALHDGTASRGRHSGGSVTHDITVTVSDGSGPISGQSKVSARKQGSDERVTEAVRGGKVPLQLSSGNWVLEAEHGGYSSSPESVRLGQLQSPDRLMLTIELPEVSLTVRDPDRDAPVPNASVRLDGDGQTLTKETDSTGAVSFDPPSGAETVTITTVHERYHESVSEFTVDRSVTETIDLDSKTGELDLVTSIDGARAGEMDVTIAPADDYLDDIYGSEVTVTSNPDGTHRSTVMVGRYRAEIDPPASVRGLYRSSEVTFEVSEDSRTEVVTDAAFTWELSSAQRDRIDQIRRELDQIVGKSGIDLAIPNYYASVIEAVLDAVEEFPEQGAQFVSVDAHPDEITDATLAAADAAVDTVADAMSAKRNRDLFTACADMPDATVRWRGNFDFPTLVERLEEDQMEVRRRYAARADSVSERIDSERGVVSEVAPARSMLEEVGIESRGDHVDEVVATHVAIMLLDAVDELFDHPELTERLSRTVF